MRSTLFYIGILAVLTFLSNCGPSAKSDGPAPPAVVVKVKGASEHDVQSLVESSNAFAFDLFRELAKREGNVVISPYSIHQAMSMAYAGSGGTTRDELRAALKYKLDDDALHRASGTIIDQLVGSGAVKSSHTLAIANAVWVQKGFAIQPTFEKLIADCYGSQATPVDFVSDAEGARKTINDWTNERTAGRISAGLPLGVVDGMTRVVLSNAAYFASPWVLRFNVNETRNEKFFITADMPVTVPMMRQKGEFVCLAFSNMKLLQMRFESKRKISMYLALPKEIGKLADLDSVDANAWQKAMDLADKMVSHDNVRVVIPRFSLSHAVALKETLRKKGIVQPFTENADFRGISDGKEPLFITDVHHSAFVKVDENGAEAAAVTDIPMAKDGPPDAPRKLTEFIADEPFLFFVVHEPTGLILFMGRVSDPR